jgi:hypothetical protein
MITLVTALLALAVTATPAKAQKGPPVDPITRLADQLYHYGLEREAHDRATFPVLIPKAGQPYDWTTGNAIDPRRVANPASKD